MDQRVLKVVALMRESLHRGWSAGELAECVNLSSSRLHQLFKEETGTPPPVTSVCSGWNVRGSF